MKKYFLILISLIFYFVDIRSQQAIDYSYGEYLYAPANKKITSLKIWLTDQKYLDELTGDAGGIVRRIDDSFLEKATKIESGDHIEYLMHFIAIDMPSFGLAFDMNVTKGSILTFETIDGKIESVNVYDYRDNTKSKLMTDFTARTSKYISNEMIIRLKLKKSELSSNKLNFYALKCYKDKYADMVPTESKSLAKTMSTSEDFCNNFVACYSDFENWQNELLSVFTIHCEIVDYTANKIWNLFASGFVLNTSDNYNEDLTRKPYALTCQHFLEKAYEIDNNVDLADVISKKTTGIRFKYQRWTCSDETAAVIPSIPRFSVISMGNYMTDRRNENDYIFLQFGDEYLSDFKHNNLGLAGWNKQNYISTGELTNMAPFVCFHHGEASGYNLFEKRFAQADYAPGVIGNVYNFTMNSGYSTEGASGSPIFDKNHMVVGMILRGNNTCSAPNAEPNYALKFSYLYEALSLSQYLGDECVAYTQNPGYGNARAICENCVRDADAGEQGIDCGGPCRPCRSRHSVGALTISNQDEFPYYASSDNTITLKSFSPNNPLKFTEYNGVNSNYVYNSKEGITLDNILIEKGVKFAANSNSDIITYDRPCTDFCGIYITNISWWGDYWQINGKGISKASYKIYNRYDKLVISESKYIYWDGWNNLWNTSTGINVNRSEAPTLFYVLELTDCFYKTHTYTGFITVFPKV